MVTAALVIAAIPSTAAAEGSGLVIDTFAGTGDPGNNGDGGPATKAALYAPTQVATAPDGTLYLVSGLTVRAVDPRTGVIRTVAGMDAAGFAGDGGPATEAKFGGRTQDTLYGLSGIDVGPDGTLYIADAGNHRVRAVDPDDGTIRTIAGIGKAKDDEHFAGDGGPARKATLYYPRDVAVGKDGTVYISDALNYRVRAVHPKTKRIRTVAGVRHPGDDGAGFFPRPDSDDTKATKSFVEAAALEVGDDGLLYLAEDQQDRIRVVDLDENTIETVAGRGGGYGSSHLDNPTDLALHGDTLYIAANDVFAVDDGKNRVYALDVEQKRLTEFAGGGKVGPLGDGGKPTGAHFGGPGPGGVLGVAAAPGGEVYVADSGNNRVRVVREGDPGSRRTAHRLAAEPIRTLLGSGKRWTEEWDEEQYSREQRPFYRDVHDLDEVHLSSPDGVAADEDGTVYVADTGNNRIRVLEPGEEKVRTLAGRPELADAYEDDGDGGRAKDAYLHAPRTLTLGPDGKLYFIDVDGSDTRIRYVDLEEKTVDTVPGSDTLDDMLDLAIDRDGTLYVAAGNGIEGGVCKFTGGEECEPVVGDDDTDDDTDDSDTSASIGNPRSIALGERTLYFTDSTTSRVRAYDLETGAVRTVAGIYGAAGLSGDGGPGTSAQLGSPGGITLGPDGTLYVVDTANHRLRAVDPKTGVITTVAGKGRFRTGSGGTSYGPQYGGGAFSGDGGAAGRAELNNPTDVEVGPEGLVYVVDEGNNRVRVVGDAGVAARGDVHGMAFAAGVLVALAALVAGFLYRRRVSTATSTGEDARTHPG